MKASKLQSFHLFCLGVEFGQRVEGGRAEHCRLLGDVAARQSAQASNHHRARVGRRAVGVGRAWRAEQVGEEARILRLEAHEPQEQHHAVRVVKVRPRGAGVERHAYGVESFGALHLEVALVVVLHLKVGAEWHPVEHGVHRGMACYVAHARRFGGRLGNKVHQGHELCNVVLQPEQHAVALADDACQEQGLHLVGSPFALSHQRAQVVALLVGKGQPRLRNVRPDRGLYPFSRIIRKRRRGLLVCFHKALRVVLGKWGSACTRPDGRRAPQCS